MSRPKPRLGRQDWIDAAIAMVEQHGLAKLAVEPLATQLGSTKGSFYWHFADREALELAVLEHWEHECTARIIATAELAAPDNRVDALLRAVTAQTDDPLERAVFAASDGRNVGPVVDRVHQSRLDYLEKLCRAAGFTARQARSRAWICYNAYLGNLQLQARSTVIAQRGQRAVDAGFRAEILAMFAND